jgi:hypothetical protein
MVSSPIYSDSSDVPDSLVVDSGSCGAFRSHCLILRVISSASSLRLILAFVFWASKGFDTSLMYEVGITNVACLMWYVITTRKITTCCRMDELPMQLCRGGTRGRVVVKVVVVTIVVERLDGVAVAITT